MAKFNVKNVAASNKTFNKEGGSAFKMSPEFELYTLACTSMLNNKFYESEKDQMKRLKSLIQLIHDNGGKKNLESANLEFIGKLAIYVREQMHLRSLPIVLGVELTRLRKECKHQWAKIDNIQKELDENPKASYFDSQDREDHSLRELDPLELRQCKNCKAIQVKAGKGWKMVKKHKANHWIQRAITRIISRADEIPEFLACYQTLCERSGVKKLNKLSNQLKYGIANAFHKFDQYSLAKYDRAGIVRLRDALFLSHSKPKGEEEETRFKQLIEGTLPPPETWEVKMSQGGQTGKDKKKTWEEMIDSKKMGFMATMRNARNFLDAGISADHINKVASYLCNEKAVLNSKQFPFRFYSAYKELVKHGSPHVHPILEALNKAIWTSVKNYPGFDGSDTVLIAADDSGSMSSELTRTMTQAEVGIVLGILLRNKCKHVTFGLFSDTFRVKQVAIGTPVLEAVNRICQNLRGCSTEAWKVMDYALKSKYNYNKVCLFSDMQFWCAEERRSYGYSHDSRFSPKWVEYHKKHPESELYMFDLAGHGTSPISTHDKNVITVAGWSDQIFSIIEKMRKGEDVLDEINAITI